MATTTTKQVLEFELGAETYCVDIDYVTEIVDVGNLTEVPNSPPHVEGVMDLRGRTTSIIDPKVVFGIEASGERQRIIVFEEELFATQTSAGWVVDEVSQVTGVDPGNVDRAPAQDDEGINGVIKQGDGEFVIWVDPQSIHA